MKFIPVNEVDSTIIGHAFNLDDRYFKKIDLTIGLFQSTKHEVIGWYEENMSENAPAVLIPKEEFQRLKPLFPEIKELENLFQENMELIVWFGKSVLQKEKYNLDHVVAHELKHIEQRNRDLSTIYRDRILSFVVHSYLSPTDIDANNFANMTVARQYDKSYNWIDEVNKLFNNNLERIKLIDEAIVRNDENITIDSEYFCELSSDQNEKDLFQYFLKRTTTKKCK